MKSNEIVRSDVSPPSGYVVVEFINRDAKGFKQDVKGFISKCVDLICREICLVRWFGEMAGDSSVLYSDMKICVFGFKMIIYDIKIKIIFFYFIR